MSPQMRTRRDGTRSPVRYRTLQPTSVVWLTALWMLLWGDLSLWMLVSGVVVALIVSLTFPLPPIVLGLKIRPLKLAWMLIHFVWEIAKASFEVAGIVLRRRGVRNSIVAVRLRSESDFALTGVAAMLSLVPGSIVVEARRSTHTLYLHVLDAHTPEKIEAFVTRAHEVEDRFVTAWGLERGEVK